jgi:hypothetical protein
MKTALAFLLLLFVIYQVQAQTSKGTIAAGGHIGFQSTSDEDINSTNKNYDGNIQPRLSYFVKDNVALSFSPLISTFKSRGSSDNFRSKSSSIGVGLGLTYYRFLSEKLAFSPVIGLDYSRLRGSTQQDGATGTTVNKFKGGVGSIYFSPRLTYFIVPKMGIDLLVGSLGYSLGTSKNDNNVKTVYNEFNFNFNLKSIGLGFQYYFVK